MTTVHATLIDYRFRALMSSVNHRKKVEKQTNKKSKGNTFSDDEGLNDTKKKQRDRIVVVACPQVEDIIAEEDQSFQLNGIIVEPKQDLTEQEKQRYKQKYQLNHPLLNPPYWVPNNIAELLLYDDDGKIKTDETICKSLYDEFTAIMSQAYGSI